MDTLPPEIIWQIAFYLSIPSLSRWCRTCKLYLDMMDKAEGFWRQKFLNDYYLQKWILGTFITIDKRLISHPPRQLTYFNPEIIDQLHGLSWKDSYRVYPLNQLVMLTLKIKDKCDNFISHHRDLPSLLREIFISRLALVHSRMATLEGTLNGQSEFLTQNSNPLLDPYNIDEEQELLMQLELTMLNQTVKTLNIDFYFVDDIVVDDQIIYQLCVNPKCDLREWEDEINEAFEVCQYRETLEFVSLTRG